ncbi:MAG: hypothetical protein H0W83_04885 [Planctomycetes bacterium]|nr:hypothetical protein [Planctomycetota bacterium]
MVRIFLLVLLLAASSTASEAVPPGLMNYQGYVERDGAPVQGTSDLLFTIVDDYGMPAWSESRPGVAIDHGFYSIVLGTVQPLSPAVFAQGPRFLQVAIDGEVLPDRRLVSVPYALVAPVADGAVTTSKLADGAVTIDKLAPGIRVSWRGGWNSAAQYQADDLVNADGSAWIAVGPSLGVRPGTGAAWQLFATGAGLTVGSGLVQTGSTVSIDPSVLRLDAQGIAIDGVYRYQRPHRMAATVAAGDFRPENQRESLSLTLDAGGWHGLGSARANDALIAPVHLPQGALVTGLIAYVYDADATASFTVNSTLSLQRLRLTAAAPAPQSLLDAALSTVGAPALNQMIECIPTTIALTPIAGDETLWLRVRLDADAASAAVRFYGCHIEYEVAAVP